MTLEVRPFEDDDVAAAGELLAARHRAQRKDEPLLDAAYEDPASARDEIAALRSAGATGAVALDHGEPVGFLLGAKRPDAVWGDNVWVEAAGHAVREAEAVRDLYAVAAVGWGTRGDEAHYAVVPASDAALVDAWFRLAFGLQQVHAVREVPAAAPVPPTGVVVRRAEHADLPVLVELDLELPRHHSRPPVFSPGHALTREQAEADWNEALDDASYASFVAEVDGDVAGAAVGCAVQRSGAHAGVARPDEAGYLAWAVVLPAGRGRGAGRALGEAVLGWCRDEGYRSVVVDWRSTNLLASRAWPRLGFRPTFFRLHRRLGH